MTSGAGESFVADVDLEAWRRPLVPWLAGGVIALVAVIISAVADVIGVGVAILLVGAALAAPGAKLGAYCFRRHRRESPLLIDVEGVRLPTGQGPAFLPWDTLRQVVVDGPTLRFRLRAGVTPGTAGVTGLHRRDAWPVASGPGLPVDTRLFTGSRDEILDAVNRFSAGRVKASTG
ncbi:hypothetical protein [Actinokineospora sp.]|uniref:hypothetical protein n=1 Tax=Actinokineospora sp. TaxID=1872133 RepID=UPI003D6BA173